MGLDFLCRRRDFNIRCFVHQIWIKMTFRYLSSCQGAHVDLVSCLWFTESHWAWFWPMTEMALMVRSRGQTQRRMGVWFGAATCIISSLHRHVAGFHWQWMVNCVIVSARVNAAYHWICIVYIYNDWKCACLNFLNIRQAGWNAEAML